MWIKVGLMNIFIFFFIINTLGSLKKTFRFVRLVTLEDTSHVNELTPNTVGEAIWPI